MKYRLSKHQWDKLKNTLKTIEETEDSISRAVDSLDISWFSQSDMRHVVGLLVNGERGELRGKK